MDGSITIEPLRECFEEIVLEGDSGLLRRLPRGLREEFEQSAPRGGVGICSDAVWTAVGAALRQEYPRLVDLLDWLIAQANPPVFNSSDPADRAWQEQQDATGCLLRIADFPKSAMAAWQRPASRDAPYLAGLVPQPVENSLIDHDVRVSDYAFNLTSVWQAGNYGRCDIHVLQDDGGRQLEVVNVNATPAEARLGTDMIYYHEPTRSFVLVQYKRLDLISRSVYVDDRLRSQLDRLEKVAQLSVAPGSPSEWRLGTDPCFLKLAYWPNDSRPVDSLAPGMYLPLSYVRILLEDDCTLGSKVNSRARVLGYKNIGRYLVGTQFIELVKHGLSGTIGTTVEQLQSLARKRAEEGQSVVLAMERSRESVKNRQARIRSRSATSKRYGHSVYSQEALF
ncbi:hypothetical protein MXD62_07255 [Frankia sp. Mgl5]|uniref:hypothetical protein n=1 Tax=Frankia sp. Mgl5 TaxID=2933793 RepID=UPI002010B7A9|nr:hypothetical protein [Frankia sp. Mgl5]MCK9926966.1 hypothetical protein [Frankia sp. Mgl5]